MIPSAINKQGELETIVQNMIDANESEENIALVIQEYSSVKKKEPTSQVGGGRFLGSSKSSQTKPLTKELDPTTLKPIAQSEVNRDGAPMGGEPLELPDNFIENKRLEPIAPSEMENRLIASSPISKQLQEKKDTENVRAYEEYKVTVPQGVIPKTKEEFEVENTTPKIAPSNLAPEGWRVDERIKTLTEEEQTAAEEDEYWKTADELSLGEKLKNSAENISTGLKMTFPKLNVAAADIWEGVLGKELARDFYKWEGRDIGQVRLNAYKEMADLKSQMLQTSGSVVDNIKYLNGSDLIVNLADALGSIVTTGVPALITAGGATIPTMVGESIIDYNEEKAKSKGITVEELYEKGDAELKTPLLIGGFAGALELVGLKSIKNLAKAGIKGKELNKLGLYAIELNKEGVTELLQTGLEEVNKIKAKGGTDEEATKGFFKKVASKEGLDSYLMGMFASGGASSLGHITGAITNAETKKEVESNISELQQLEQDLTNPNVSAASKAIIEEQAIQKIQDISTAIDESDKAYEQLSAKDKVKSDELNAKKTELETIVADPNISEVSKKLATEQLEPIDEELKTLGKETEVVEEVKVEEIETPKEAETVEVAEIKEPVNGDQVIVPSKIEGITDRLVEFKDGEWQQKVGDIYTKLPKNVQDEASQLFSKIENPIVEDPTEEVSTEDITPTEETKTEAAETILVEEVVTEPVIENPKDNIESTQTALEDAYYNNKNRGDAKYHEEKIIDLIPKEITDEIFDKTLGDGWKKGVKKGLVAKEMIDSLKKSFLSNQRQRIISEAYYKAKKEGNNPELIKSVDELLGSNVNPTEPVIENTVETVVELTPEPEVLKPIKEPTKLEQAKQRASEAKEKLKKLGVNVGIANDPKEKAKAYFEYHSALVEVAKEAISEGITTVKEFAEQLGEKVTKSLKQAWNEAKGGEPLTVEDFDEDNFVSIKKSETEKIREEMGMPRFEKKTDTNEEQIRRGKELLEGGYDVFGLVNEVVEGKVPNEDETAILTLALGARQSQLDEVKKRISGQKDNRTEDFERDSAKLEQYTQDIRELLEAASVGGSAKGRALQSQNIFAKKDYTLAKAVMDYRKAKGSKLTDAEYKNLENRIDEIEKINAELQAKLSEFESQKSEKATDEERKAFVKETNRQYKNKTRAEIKDIETERRKKIKEQFAQLIKKSMGEMGVNPIKAEMTPLIKEYSKSLISESINVTIPNLRDKGLDYSKELAYNTKALLKKLKEDLLDILPVDVTEEDIADAITGRGYERPKRTKTELESTLQTLKNELELTKKIEELEKGILPDKPLPKLKEDRLADLKQRVRQLQKLNKVGRYSEEAKDQSSKTRLDNEIKKVEQDIKDKNYEKPVKEEVLESEEVKDLKRKLSKAKYQLEYDAAKAELDKRSKFKKITDVALDIANIPRAIQSSFDFSAPLRQAGIATLANPKKALAIGKEMFKDTVNEERYDKWVSDLIESPGYEMMKKSGLAVVDLKNPKLTAHEERFTSNLANKIPLVGKGVKASERAYTSYLNRIRVELFSELATQLQNDGYSFIHDNKAYKAAANYVNMITGRGNLGESLEKAAPILNTVFFSPRLMAARIRQLTYWAQIAYSEANNLAGGKRTIPKAIAKMYAMDMVKYIATNGLLMEALVLATAGYDDKDKFSVELDPRSTDFGKLRIGDTRYDLFAGHLQYIRFIAQQLTQEKKSTTTGDIKKLDGTGYDKATRGSEQLKFLRTKLAPTSSFVVDFMGGQDMMGVPISETSNIPVIDVPVYDALWKRILPLNALGFAESLESKGAGGALVDLGVSTIGEGVQTYNSHSFLKTGVDDEIIDLIENKKASVFEPIQDKIKIVNKETGEEEGISNKEYVKFYDNWTDYIKADLLSKKQEYDKMDKETFKTEFDQVKRKAKQYAEEKVSGLPTDIDKIQTTLERTPEQSERGERGTSITYQLTPEQTKVRIEKSNEAVQEFYDFLKKYPKVNPVTQAKNNNSGTQSEQESRIKLAEMELEVEANNAGLKASKDYMLELQRKGEIKLER